jgi:hypothetical protein
MNVQDILKYGHLTVLNSVDSFPQEHVDLPGAVGYWSVKDVVAHLASYELVLVEILSNIVAPCPTSLTDELKADGQAFNDRQVDMLRKDRSIDQVFDEYKSAYERTATLAARIPGDLWRQNGILPWYGAEYDLDDFVAYTYYGHKREHCGQIEVFGDRFKQPLRANTASERTSLP